MDALVQAIGSNFFIALAWCVQKELKLLVMDILTWLESIILIQPRFLSTSQGRGSVLGAQGL